MNTKQETENNLNNIPLDLKYRPKKFVDMFQPHISKALKNSIKNNRISSTLIFTGWTGTGKTSMARIYAAALNCEQISEDFEPCGICNSCKSIFSINGNSMDVEEINASEKTGIDDVRKIIEDKYHLSPVMGKYRIFILDESHSMSLNAQNALLKPLEEPPPNVVFIICTTELEKMISTIQCRSQIWSFERVPDSVISENLKLICKNENFKYEDDAIQMISILSEGSPRASIKMLEQMCGDVVSTDVVNEILKVSPRNTSIDIIEAAVNGNTKFIIETIDILNSRGKNLVILLKQISEDLSKIIKIIANVNIEADQYIINRYKNIISMIPQEMRKKKIKAASSVIIDLFEQINYRNAPKDLVLINGLIEFSLVLKN
jgi:DNA polymerase-3 subunit gamma/tau